MKSIPWAGRVRLTLVPGGGAARVVGAAVGPTVGGGRVGASVAPGSGVLVGARAGVADAMVGVGAGAGAAPGAQASSSTVVPSSVARRRQVAIARSRAASTHPEPGSPRLRPGGPGRASVATLAKPGILGVSQRLTPSIDRYPYRGR